ncbi:MAG: type II toxin-antitoxin system RelE/ParE family toxin [Gammaproteobacteria bacterium]|nr:type II toxin-antitoxin system RelE/ParE family toxin [Gammaproteobacteria bacterium]
MGKVDISFAASAVSDLEEIRIWYADQDVPDVGKRLIGEIFQRIETLETHPKLGRIVPEFDQPYLRELIQVPFRIIYRRDPGKVRIVRIWRSERLIRLPDEL